MYAVIKTGGKQYRVKAGDVIKIEQLPGDVGQAINFAEVLLIADGDQITTGQPMINNAVVTAEVVAHGRHKKIRIIKFRRRKHHMKRMGHRQNFTQVKITAINVPFFKTNTLASKSVFMRCNTYGRKNGRVYPCVSQGTDGEDPLHHQSHLN